jgi:2-hydroxychromene-2-carboxylate isomerase
MASLKAFIGRSVTRAITSHRTLHLRRRAHAWARKLTGRKATIHFFHQQDDPYSQLLARYLPTLQQRYRVQLRTYLVPPPEAAAAPDLQRLVQWSLRDARRLAASLPPPPATPVVPDASFELNDKASNAALRTRWGHYLGGTLFYEGEWYWGTDRLHYLEQRLRSDGLLQEAVLDRAPPLLIEPQTLQFTSRPALRGSPPVIHFFCSLRSPYTYLAAAAIRRLAEHYGARLELRYVLPMVMRGLPVPLAKRLYILRDTKREADRLGIPFGAVVDPVGPPVEQGLAVLHAAIQRGTGPQFLEAFLQGVFAEGLDAGDPKVMARFASAAAMSSADVDAALRDPGWRNTAEANRADMLAQGLWGVPSFCVEGHALLWGQDRLWMLEEDLIAALNARQDLIAAP